MSDQSLISTQLLLCQREYELIFLFFIDKATFHRNHAPGESPYIVETKEQRVSGIVMSLLCGLSIFAEPILKQVPISVLFGVFLYMGICSMDGVQFFERFQPKFMIHLKFLKFTLF